MLRVHLWEKRMQHILNNEKVLIIGGSSDIGIQLVKNFYLRKL